MITFSFPAKRTDIARAVATMLNTIADGEWVDPNRPKRAGQKDSPLVDSVKTAELDQAQRAEEKWQAGLDAGVAQEQALDTDMSAAHHASSDPMDNAADEYEQVAVDAILACDTAAEVSTEQLTAYGNNLRRAYGARGDDMASLVTAAEIIADTHDPEGQLESSLTLISTLLLVEDKPAGGKLDEHGVAFCDKHCAVAADPFNKTGKTKGQWKKKRGVTQEVYDAWYEANRPATTGANNDTPIDTSQAFGAGNTAQPDAGCPKTPGELIMWVSELQTAGHITATSVSIAYEDAGVVGSNVALLFSATPEQQAVYISKIYEALKA